MRMKRIWLTLWLLFAVGFSALTVTAEEAQEEPDKVVDEASLLTYGERTRLEMDIDKVVEKYGMDVAVVTKRNVAGNVQTYADDLFESAGYGVGEEKDGILVLVDMSGRELVLTAHGKGIDVFTDFRKEEILDRMAEYLSMEDYKNGFGIFVNDVEYYLGYVLGGAEEEGQAEALPPIAIAESPAETTAEPFQMPEEPKQGKELEQKTGNGHLNILKTAIIGGLIIAVLWTGVKGSGMKNVKKQEGAKEYAANDRCELTKNQDIFLYTRVTKKKIQKKDSGTRSYGSPRVGTGSGTSTTHTSRSGERYSGAKRKF